MGRKSAVRYRLEEHLEVVEIRAALVLLKLPFGIDPGWERWMIGRYLGPEAGEPFYGGCLWCHRPLGRKAVRGLCTLWCQQHVERARAEWIGMTEEWLAEREGETYWSIMVRAAPEVDAPSAVEWLVVEWNRAGEAERLWEQVQEPDVAELVRLKRLAANGGW